MAPPGSTASPSSRLTAPRWAARRRRPAWPPRSSPWWRWARRRPTAVRAAGARGRCWGGLEQDLELRAAALPLPPAGCPAALDQRLGSSCPASQTHDWRRCRAGPARLPWQHHRGGAGQRAVLAAGTLGRLHRRLPAGERWQLGRARKLAEPAIWAGLLGYAGLLPLLQAPAPAVRLCASWLAGSGRPAASAPHPTLRPRSLPCAPT